MWGWLSTFKSISRSSWLFIGFYNWINGNWRGNNLGMVGWIGLAAVWQANVSATDWAQTHPGSHGIDDGNVTMDTSVARTCVSTGAWLVSWHEWNCLAGLTGHFAQATIRKTVWYTFPALVVIVGAEDETDWPVFGIVAHVEWTVEKLGLEVSMGANWAVFDQDTTELGHVSRTASWTLLIVIVVLNDYSLSIKWIVVWLLWIQTVPHFNLLDLAGWTQGLSKQVLESAAVPTWTYLVISKV